jgi:hypothetical protein
MAGVALATLSAHAQVFQYNDGDLILDFSKSGDSDLEVDIGNISQFTSVAAGTTVAVGGYSVANQLNATFGSLDSVQFSVFGSQVNGTASGNPLDFLSLRELVPGTQNSAPHDFTASKDSSVSGAETGIIGYGTASGILPYSANNPSDPAGNTTTAVIIPTSGVVSGDSFTKLYNGSGGLKSLIASPGIVNTLPSNFVETSGAVAVSDLFEYAGNGGSAFSSYLGDFTLSNNGQLDFTAVPEPMSYGLTASAGLLVLAFRHQLRRLRSA